MVITHLPRVYTEVLARENVLQLHFLAVLDLRTLLLPIHLLVVEVFKCFLLLELKQLCLQMRNRFVNLCERLVVILLLHFLAFFDHLVTLFFLLLNELLEVDPRFVLNQEEALLDLALCVPRVLGRFSGQHFQIHLDAAFTVHDAFVGKLRRVDHLGEELRLSCASLVLNDLVASDHGLLIRFVQSVERALIFNV